MLLSLTSAERWSGEMREGKQEGVRRKNARSDRDCGGNEPSEVQEQDDRAVPFANLILGTLQGKIMCCSVRLGPVLAPTLSLCTGYSTIVLYLSS